MAKRVDKDEKPYRPVDEALVRSVLRGPNIEGNTNEAEPQVEDLSTENSSSSVRVLSDNSSHISQQSQDLSLISSIATTASEKLTREKRVLLTKTEEREIERFVDRIGEQLETSLKLSHLLRACLKVLKHAENEIIMQAQKSSKVERPPNGDLVALAEFEFQIAQILSSALRKSSQLR